MSDLQMYILVGIPLVGILSNTALFIHVSGRLDRMAERLSDRIDALSDRVAGLTERVTRIEVKLGIGRDTQ